jgi:hypothetical protein
MSRSIDLRPNFELYPDLACVLNERSSAQPSLILIDVIKRLTLYDDSSSGLIYVDTKLQR